GVPGGAVVEIVNDLVAPRDCVEGAVNRVAALLARDRTLGLALLDQVLGPAFDADLHEHLFRVPFASGHGHLSFAVDSPIPETARMLPDHPLCAPGRGRINSAASPQDAKQSRVHGRIAA